MGPFTGKPLAAIAPTTLQRFVDNGVPETLHLDYKRELTVGDKESKKEFLRDLTAFANAEGGTIIYGVDEERDAAGKQTGLPKSIDGFSVPNPDALVLLIDQLIKDGIDERLPSYELSSIALTGDRQVVLVRVPTSLRAPHMVTLAGERRLFIRGNTDDRR